MIILDETRLTNGTIRMIGEDYGMQLSSPIEIDTIIDRFKFDIDSFKERLIEAIKNELRLK